MNNRTTQRLIDQNVSRHLVTEQIAKEERLSEDLGPISTSKTPFSKWGPLAGVAAVIMQLLSMIGL